MKRNLKNYAKKLLLIIVIAVTAIINPAFGQVPAPDFDIYYYYVKFSPNQQLRFRLPNDIRSGDMITGTVIEEKKTMQGT